MIPSRLAISNESPCRAHLRFLTALSLLRTRLWWCGAILEPDIQRPCPICGTEENSRLFAEANFDLTRLNGFAFASRKFPEHMHLRLHECRRCDSLYASPVFASGTLAVAYRDAAYDSAAIAHLAAQTYARYLPGLIARLPSLEGALDVGAGDGAFVSQLVRHGFTNVTGVEPSIAAVAMAPREIKKLIRRSCSIRTILSPTRFRW